MQVPHTTTPLWPAAMSASRFGSTIKTNSRAGCDIALLGLPDDLGVRLNHGRPGAAIGPFAFRAALAKYGTATPQIRLPRVFDAGDVTPEPDSLDETHRRVTEAAAALHDQGLLPVGIGGGHDLTYPFVRAAAEHAGEPLVGVYFDAHLDVRAEEGSGMPFRRLVEGEHCREFHVHGLDQFSNTAEHVAWFHAHGGHVDPFGSDDPWPEGKLFVSLDLDVIDQAYAPGVSAMNPSGWTPDLAARWCRSAGRCERVVCFDIMELSPPHDVNGRTARLAARLFLEFLAGVAERPR